MTRCLITLTLLTQLASLSRAALLEYTAAHADIRPVYDNQELSLRYRFDTNAVLDGTPNPSPALVAPDDAYVRVPDTTIIDPADQSLFFSFFPDMFVSLGEPTTPYWVLPQGNVVGQPFFGFSTEELVSADWGATFEVDAEDYQLWRGHYSAVYPGAGVQPTQPVPEPACAAMAACVLLITLALRYRCA